MDAGNDKRRRGAHGHLQRWGRFATLAVVAGLAVLSVAFPYALPAGDFPWSPARNDMGCGFGAGLMSQEEILAELPAFVKVQERHPWKDEVRTCLTRSIHLLVFESQLPHTTANLLFELVIVNNELTI